ncbi:MAG: YbaN family protein [Candidatus Eisenbacteria bacterium]
MNERDEQMDRNGSEARALAISPGRSIRRWTFALLGVLSVAIGFIGVFLPGLPTTIFLLFASYCFTRSCPWLEDKLVKAPIFRPYLRYLNREEGMPLRARLVTIAMIWIASSISCYTMYLRGGLETWFVATIGSAALIGSIVVSRVFRGTKTESSGGI